MTKIYQNILIILVLCIGFMSCGKDPYDKPDPVIIYPEKKLKAGFIVLVNSLHNTHTIKLFNVSQKATSIRWDFGDGNNTVSGIDEYTYANPGTYIITLEASDGSATDTFTDTVVIVAGVTHNLLFADNKAMVSDTCGCSPFEAMFEFINDGTWLYHEWIFGDPASSSNNSLNPNPTHVYNQGGSYNIQLTISNNDTGYYNYYNMPALIKVHNTPIAGLAAFPTVTSILHPEIEFNNMSSGYEYVYWSFGDGCVSTESNPRHTYIAVGDYSVMLIAYNRFGCYDIFYENIKIQADQR